VHRHPCSFQRWAVGENHVMLRDIDQGAHERVREMTRVGYADAKASVEVQDSPVAKSW
jgi:hypothetical protein